MHARIYGYHSAFVNTLIAIVISIPNLLIYIDIASISPYPALIPIAMQLPRSRNSDVDFSILNTGDILLAYLTYPEEVAEYDATYFLTSG